MDNQTRRNWGAVEMNITTYKQRLDNTERKLERLLYQSLINQDPFEQIDETYKLLIRVRNLQTKLQTQIYNAAIQRADINAKPADRAERSAIIHNIADILDDSIGVVDGSIGFVESYYDDPLNDDTRVLEDVRYKLARFHEEFLGWTDAILQGEIWDEDPGWVLDRIEDVLRFIQNYGSKYQNEFDDDDYHTGRAYNVDYNEGKKSKAAGTNKRV